MSARQKETVLDRPSSVTLLASLLESQHADNMARILPHADRALPALIADGIDTCQANETARKIAARIHRGYRREVAALRRLAKAHGGDMENALDAVRWQEGDVCFSLGLALGLRLGGVR